MSTTIFLYPDTWDLAIDAKGDIATATKDYAIAQDVASACRLWLGEAMYNRTRGIPYKYKILGQFPSVSLMNDWFKTEAETVEGVASATPYLQVNNRELVGFISISTAESGETFNVRI